MDAEEEGSSAVRPASGPSGERSRAHGLTVLAGLVYGAMAAAGIAWLAFLDRLEVLRADPSSLLGRLGVARELWGNLGTGMLLGLGIVAATQLLARRSAAARFLEQQFQEALAGLRPAQALLLAGTSAVGEELLFRGGLQTWLSDLLGPAAGLSIASVLFGAVHAGRDRRFLLWTAFALGTGFVLGGLYLATGSLLAPIALHATANGTNLLVEAWEQRSAQRTSRISPR